MGAMTTTPSLPATACVPLALLAAKRHGYAPTAKEIARLVGFGAVESAHACLRDSTLYRRSRPGGGVSPARHSLTGHGERVARRFEAALLAEVAR